MSESEPKPNEFKQSLNAIDGTLLVAGGMIGSGIFIVSADIARNVGSPGWLLLTWLITGVVTVAAALSYGELAGMMPKAGGQYIYIQRAFGPLTSFVYGWTVFTVIQTGTIAAVAVAFIKFTAYFVPALNPENTLFSISSLHISLGQLVAIASIILLTYINTKGVQSGKIIQNTFTSAKLIALFGLIAVGIWYGLSSGLLSTNLTNMWDAQAYSKADGLMTPIGGMALLMAVGVSMIGSLFSSDAWNNVTFIAAEMKNPKRNIPLSLFFGTLIVTVLYIFANLAYLGTLTIQQIQTAEYDRVATASMSVIFGDAAAAIMALLIMVSTFGCNNGLILSGARLYYAMAQDGLFFKSASVLNHKGVPEKALWLQCLWSCLLCFSGTYNQLLTYCTFGSLIFYMVTISSIFVLRKKEPNLERPYRAFGYPIVPALYILVTLGICIILLIDPKTRTDSGIGLLIAAVGIPVYYLVKKKG
jgi:basic amino acid/polyamine antiporter, APA family